MLVNLFNIAVKKNAYKTIYLVTVYHYQLHYVLLL